MSAKGGRPQPTGFLANGNHACFPLLKAPLKTFGTRLTGYLLSVDLKTTPLLCDDQSSQHAYVNGVARIPGSVPWSTMHMVCVCGTGQPVHTGQ